MSRYIDTDILYVDWYDSFVADDGTEYDNIPLISKWQIDEAPSIDIVFCKECKHRPVKEDADGVDWGFNIIAPEGSSRCPCLVDDGWYSWMPPDNFFCGYGESKEGE